MTRMDWAAVRALYRDLRDNHWTVVDASFWLALTLLALIGLLLFVGILS